MQTPAPLVFRPSHDAILLALNAHSVLSPSQLTRLLLPARLPDLRL